jgi:membrane fusion protein (multidrug efflux system)
MNTDFIVKKLNLSKPMLIMLLVVGGLFTLIFGYQMIKSSMIQKYIRASSVSVVSVATTTVEKLTWQPQLKSVATLRAVQGVDVTAELSGVVQTIHFTPGASVEKGDPLIDLNTDTEMAQLQALEAATDLAKIVHKRDNAQLAIKAISQAVVDADAADLKSKEAQVAQQKAVIDKKKSKAPFAGKLGISLVTVGQYVNAGDKLVTLQSLDPLYADFHLPQQALKAIKSGQKVSMTVDTYPEEKFSGTITTIDPKVDPETRNVKVEATIENPNKALLPGMFVNIKVDTGTEYHYLTVPQSAISFNPYGEIVYVVKETGKDDKGTPIFNATQAFVKVGDIRGDEIAVLEGLNEGDIIVTSGQLKLKNGSLVKINNRVLPNTVPNSPDE